MCHGASGYRDLPIGRGILLVEDRILEKAPDTCILMLPFTLNRQWFWCQPVSVIMTTGSVQYSECGKSQIQWETSQVQYEQFQWQGFISRNDMKFHPWAFPPHPSEWTPSQDPGQGASRLINPQLPRDNWTYILGLKKYIPINHPKIPLSGLPGGLVVKTPSFWCKEHWFNPWSGNLDPTCSVAWPIKH